MQVLGPLKIVEIPDQPWRRNKLAGDSGGADWGGCLLVPKISNMCAMPCVYRDV